MTPLTVLPPASTDSAVKELRCGTLAYTRAGLFLLFTWLLWGDFCFSLMENIWPSLLPLMLKSQGASNAVLALVITTIPSAMNFILNPIISTASDRFRSRWGRRIPFLLFATPFVVVFLVLLGFAPNLAHALKGWVGEALTTSEAGLAIWLIGALVVGFRFFELFVNTVFWYLFNDVVPAEVMGRFVALFRMVGLVAGALFSFFLYGFAGTHASIIFLGVAVLYGTVFLAMCFNVKEGAYPPPSPRPGPGFSLSAVVTFFRECFSHRVFRLVYGYNFLFAAANAINTFLVFHALSVGLGLDAFGKVTGAVTFLGAFLIYPMGSLVDRFHPLRLMIAAQAGFCLALASKLVFLAYEFAANTAFWVYAATAIVAIPATVANAAAGLPMVMRLFPRERFGQFCSANAMCGALGTMIGGVLAGFFLDTLKTHFSAGSFYYRFTPLWSLACTCLSFLVMILLYREWKRLGGDISYRPPDK